MPGIGRRIPLMREPHSPKSSGTAKSEYALSMPVMILRSRILKIAMSLGIKRRIIICLTAAQYLSNLH